MIIQFIADDRDFEDLFIASQLLINQLQQWLNTENQNELVTLIDQRLPAVNDIDDYDPFKPPSWKIGLQVVTQKTRAIKGPLKILSACAKQHQLDFAINILDQDKLRPVAYFGAFEGSIDLFELSWQLGLKS